MIPGPAYELVPKDLALNIAFRRRALKLGRADAQLAHQLKLLCAREPLFWVNTFLYTMDPRKSPGDLPWITYPYQDDVFEELFACVKEQRSAVIKKSRDMGATWMAVAVILHEWQFAPKSLYSLVSRNEDYVDKTGDPKSLFAKLDYMLQYQPCWLKPAGFNTSEHRRKLHLHNPDSGSTINGESTTGDILRGDRRRAVLLDEFGSVDFADARRALRSVQYASNCRIFNSTSVGPVGPFHDLCESPAYRQIRLHWTKHPEKIIGRYEREGKVRSTWYDQACQEASSPADVARELDMEDEADSYQFFHKELLVQLEMGIKQPLEIWDWKTTVDNLERYIPRREYLRKTRHGSMNLWTPLEDGMPLCGPCVVALDLSEGTGASNSVAVVFDHKFGRKVAEFVTADTPPHEFSLLAMGIAAFFRKAMLWWESNGPGKNVGREIVESGYRPVWTMENATGYEAKRLDIPGWHSNHERRKDMLQEFRSALSRGKFQEPSQWAIKELSCYVNKGRFVVHCDDDKTSDPSGANDNHGDRVIASAGAWMAAKRVMGTADVPRQPEPEDRLVSQYSLGARGDARERERREEDDAF